MVLAGGDHENARQLAQPQSGAGECIGSGHYYHFRGAAAWLMFAGFVCLGASAVIVIWRRLKTKPGGKTDQRAAEIMAAMAGAFIILAMMVLKSVGLV